MHHLELGNGSLSLPSHLGVRLEKLNQEIRDRLEEVRRHIQELEAVEQKVRSGRAGQRFPDLLERAIEGGDSRPSRS